MTSVDAAMYQPQLLLEPQAVASVPRLFVGQLPTDKQEADLIELFGKFGEIEKITVVRGPEQRSRGCAMVQFRRWSCAEAASEAINGKNPFEGKGRPLVVHFANPRKSPVLQNSELAIAPRKLFIGQIPKNCAHGALVDLFSRFGQVDFVNVVSSKNNANHASCAFVQFSKWSSCEAAIDELHDTYVMPGCDHPLVVKFADAKPVAAPTMLGPAASIGPASLLQQQKDGVSGMGAAHRGNRTSNTPYMMTMHGAFPGHPSDMAAMAMGSQPTRYPTPYGMHTSPNGHPYGGRMRGGVPPRRGMLGSNEGRGSSDSLVDHSGSSETSDSGAHHHGLAPLSSGVHHLMPLPHDPVSLIHYQYQQYMQYAHMMGMQPVAVAPSSSGKVGHGVVDPGVYAHKLFVGQVPFEASEHELWHMFAPFGDVLELAVLRSGGISRGCAFLTYATRQQALGAIRTLHGRPVGPNKRLVVKFADHKTAGQSSGDSSGGEREA